MLWIWLEMDKRKYASGAQKRVEKRKREESMGNNRTISSMFKRKESESSNMDTSIGQSDSSDKSGDGLCTTDSISNTDDVAVEKQQNATIDQQEASNTAVENCDIHNSIGS